MARQCHRTVGSSHLWRGDLQWRVNTFCLSNPNTPPLAVRFLFGCLWQVRLWPTRECDPKCLTQRFGIPVGLLSQDQNLPQLDEWPFCSSAAVFSGAQGTVHLRYQLACLGADPLKDNITAAHRPERANEIRSLCLLVAIQDAQLPTGIAFLDERPRQNLASHSLSTTGLADEQRRLFRFDASAHQGAHAAKCWCPDNLSDAARHLVSRRDSGCNFRLDLLHQGILCVVDAQFLHSLALLLQRLPDHVSVLFLAQAFPQQRIALDGQL
mmetsp:Transcript_81177/g.263068  ORF Transcript_81177/g.263068 Transcript_81177/m.263068 type:complete len:268 (-) Transcript_81177:1222-2025(-)